MGRWASRVRALSDTSVAAATPGWLGLMGLTYALVRASDWLRDRWRAWRYTPAVSMTHDALLATSDAWIAGDPDPSTTARAARPA
jgi:hypothetical protein